MLLPKVVRKQISYRKFQRVARSPDSKRVRCYLHLEAYKINTTVNAYTKGDYVYVEQLLRCRGTYKVFFFRYRHNESVYILR